MSESRRLMFERRAENLWPKRRNIRVAPLVYTGAVRYEAVLGKIQKNPAVAAAGL